MPDWAKLQVLVGAALSGGVFAHGVWGRRPALHLVAELVSGACCAALFLAYWDIRINAALGGWVIPLFLYVILREGRYALGANPPIHFIVENGRLTLKGIVMNTLDRQVAESLVRTSVLAFDVKNELQIESRY